MRNFYICDVVAFAGRKYAARSIPAFVTNWTYTVTQFYFGSHYYIISVNIYSFFYVNGPSSSLCRFLKLKREDCRACTGKEMAAVHVQANLTLVFLNNQVWAIRTNCKNGWGSVNCNLGIQLAFSWTDKHHAVFNSWYEVKNLRQYSLYGFCSNLRETLTSQYNKVLLVLFETIFTFLCVVQALHFRFISLKFQLVEYNCIPSPLGVRMSWDRAVRIPFSTWYTEMAYKLYLSFNDWNSFNCEAYIKLNPKWLPTQ